MKSKKKIILIVVLIFLLGIMLFIFGNKKMVTEIKGLVEKEFLTENDIMPIADNEVQIGDQGYAKLEDALAVVKNGEEIDLLKNVERDIEIVVPRNIDAIIDLNGFSINNTTVTSTNDSYSLKLNSPKKLIIKDSGTSGTINGISCKISR